VICAFFSRDLKDLAIFQNFRLPEMQNSLQITYARDFHYSTNSTAVTAITALTALLQMWQQAVSLVVVDVCSMVLRLEMTTVV
jgi:hypothetical protein